MTGGFRAHIETLGFLAAASRAFPFIGWSTGWATAVPGVNIPGVRHRNILLFDTACSHRGGAAECLLSGIVQKIEARNGGSRMQEEPGGNRDGRELGDVDMGDDTAVHEDGGVHSDCDGGHLGAEAGSRCGDPGENKGEGRTGHPNGANNPGYAGGTGSPCPCEPPYSRTPTGAVQSDELREDLQLDRGAPHGRKRDGSPTTEQQELEPRAVRRCLSTAGLEWSVQASDGRRDDRSRRVYLPSLSDGVGTAMLAKVELFTALGCQGRFAGGWFAESEDHLANPVARHWANCRGRGGSSYESVAGDVWDLGLLRHKGRALAAMRAKVEPNALHVIIGGSPCQQLTLAGRHGGKEGLCGDDSWNFYVFPLILHAAKQARPDVEMHVAVENAGSMIEKFKRAIIGALGIPFRGNVEASNGLLGLRPAGGREFAPVIDARHLSPFTWKRIFFSTFPPSEDQWTIRGGRPPPWDEGWERRSTGGLGPLRDMPPMMRGRGPHPGIRPSSYQFHPDFLLYNGNMPNIVHYRIILANIT